MSTYAVTFKNEAGRGLRFDADGFTKDSDFMYFYISEGDGAEEVTTTVAVVAVAVIETVIIEGGE